jgi:hypothetical protein
MTIVSVHTAECILATAKLLKRNPACNLSRIYFVLRTVYEVNQDSVIDVQTLAQVITPFQEAQYMQDLLVDEYIKVKKSEPFHSELLRLVYVKNETNGLRTRMADYIDLVDPKGEMTWMIPF